MSQKPCGLKHLGAGQARAKNGTSVTSPSTVRLHPRAGRRRDPPILVGMSVDATVPVVAAGLVGGYAVARFSNRRELGGVVLGTAGAWCTSRWARRGRAVAGGLLATYLVAFGASHPLAKTIGAWPSVGVVTAGASAVTYALTR